jgi:hypothetical protein
MARGIPVFLVILLLGGGVFWALVGAASLPDGHHFLDRSPRDVYRSSHRRAERIPLSRPIHRGNACEPIGPEGQERPPKRV